MLVYFFHLMRGELRSIFCCTVTLFLYLSLSSQRPCSASGSHCEQTFHQPPWWFLLFKEGKQRIGWRFEMRRHNREIRRDVDNDNIHNIILGWFSIAVWKRNAKKSSQKAHESHWIAGVSFIINSWCAANYCSISNDEPNDAQNISNNLYFVQCCKHLKCWVLSSKRSLLVVGLQTVSLLYLLEWLAVSSNAKRRVVIPEVVWMACCSTPGKSEVFIPNLNCHTGRQSENPAVTEILSL